MTLEELIDQMELKVQAKPPSATTPLSATAGDTMILGYTANQNESYTFYTRGVDRLTSWDSSFLQSRTGIPFSQADALWTTFQNSISNFVQSHQGNANVNLKEILRPDWQKVKDVIEGKKPLSTLSKNCPD